MTNKTEANNDEVICPACANQFRAIPVNVQAMLKAAGHTPPYLHSKPTSPAAERAIAGALFDFLGYLTSRDDSVSLGSQDLATPAVDLLQDWAKTRNLNLAEANVMGWRDALKETT